MRPHRSILALFIALCLVTGAWAQSRVALVIIASEGPAQVILSGRLVGVANPRLTTQVAPGTYELLVRKPGLPEFRQRITVGSGGLTINVPLGGAAIQPAPQPIQPIQPAPQVIQPAPQAVQPAPAASGRGIQVTFIWHAADTADIYINGVPIKTFSPDYRTRGDEAPAQPFSQSSFIKHGDIITVGTRRGGSYGFMMVVVDASGTVLLRTDETWQWYDGSSDPLWYEPSAWNRAARKGAVQINPTPWGNQNGMVTRYGSGLKAIYSSSTADRMTNLYHRVNMPGITGVSSTGTQSGSPAPGISSSRTSYEYQFVPLSGLSNLRAAVRGSDRFIIAGDGGTPYISTDGRSWQAGSTLPLYNVVDLAWGNGQYIAVGDGGRLATSNDGVNWTSRTSGSSRHLASALWTGSQYIVTGQGGTLLTSRDGATWTSVPSNVSSHLVAVSQDREGGTVAIVAMDGTILCSKNGGQSWQRSSVGLGTGTIHSMVGGPHGFVVAASSADGRIFHSPDAVNWREVYRGDGKTGHSGGFWDGANYLFGGLGYILVSPDGISWTKLVLPQSKPVGKSAIGNGVLITVSGDGTGVFRSPAAAMASAPSRPAQAATPATPAQPGVSPASPASPAASSSQGKSWRVGEPGPAGGIIVYDKGNDSGGWRYIEAGPVDIDNGSVALAPDFDATGARGLEVGTGFDNTAAIIRKYGSGAYPASMCNEYRLGGYNDWYLPSRDELNLLYTLLYKNGKGGFSPRGYASSSESRSGEFWIINFQTGRQLDDAQAGWAFNVRPVRRFGSGQGR